MMNKIVLNGLTFRVDKHCPMTRKSLVEWQEQRYRYALYAFRKMFSQEALEGRVCASDLYMKRRWDRVIDTEMNYLGQR